MLRSFGDLPSSVVRPLIVLFALTAAWALVLFEQVTLSPLFAESLIPDVWEQASKLLRMQLPASVSVVREQPLLAAGPQIVCWLAFSCGLLIGANSILARRTLRVFAISGVAYACYAIVAFAFWPNHLLWQEKLNYRGSLAGTFTNANVAAVYFGACSVPWLLLIAKQIDKRPGERGESRLMLILRHPPRSIAIYLTGFATVFGAMLMTASRAGTILVVLTLIAAIATRYRQTIQANGKAAVAVTMAVVATSILIFLDLFASRLSQRFNIEGAFDGPRFKAYISTSKIIADHPWIGTGLGTFRWIFPHYRSGDVPAFGTWEQAHNVPLEFASEMGIPFAIAFVCCWLAVITVLGNLELRESRWISGSAFWIAMLASLHSLVDFSMQVPGFAIPTLAVTGTGFAWALRGLRFTKFGGQ